MHDQGLDKKASESKYSKRDHPIETGTTPPNPDPPIDAAARPPYGGPEGGGGKNTKK